MQAIGAVVTIGHSLCVTAQAESVMLIGSCEHNSDVSFTTETTTGELKQPHRLHCQPCMHVILAHMHTDYTHIYSKQDQDGLINTMHNS